MKSLTSEEVFDLLNKHAAALKQDVTSPRETAVLEDLKMLAKSHESLRHQVTRLDGFIDLGYELMAKAKRKP